MIGDEEMTLKLLLSEALYNCSSIGGIFIKSYFLLFREWKLPSVVEISFAP